MGPTHCSQLHLPGGASRLSRGVPGVCRGERQGQDSGGRAGGSLPAALDGAQISAPPVPLWAHLELDQRKNSTAGGAEPGLTPNKPAPHCPALPSENHSQGPLPAPAHHALRLRAGGSLMPPEAPECPPSNCSSVCPLPPPPVPTRRGGHWTPGGAALSLEDQAGPSVQQGSWQLPRAAPARQLQWMLCLSRHGAPKTWAPWLQSDTTRPVHSSQVLKCATDFGFRARWLDGSSGFRGGSDGKESCSERDLSSIPGSGRSPDV